MIAVDKPLNWQDNKDYCKRFESNLIFLSGQKKSKFLRNKMALILEKNHDYRGGLSLGPNRTSNGLIFIGKSIPIEPWTRARSNVCYFRWKIFDENTKMVRQQQ